jgi:DNA-binding transcriptional ArsR family regulator
MASKKSVEAAFRAVADSTRRSILTIVREEAQAVATIAERFPGISRPAISKHLRILKAAGLVSEEQRGRQRFYRFVDGTLDELGNWLEEFRERPAAGKAGACSKEPAAELLRPPENDPEGWQVW